jgi:hypothetical protein
MRKVITYRIAVVSTGPDAVTELQEQVNELIERGWEPQGGVAAWSSFLGQAMVKTIDAT